MLVVYGEVGDLNSPEEFVGNLEECNMKCLSEVDCVLTRQTGAVCQIFRYGNVRTVTKSEYSNVLIGFKRTLICSPGMADPPLDGSEIVTETYKIETIAYNYTITKSGPLYTFNFNYFIQCQEDSFVVLRGSNVICVSIRVFPEESQCQNRTNGLKLCSENRGNGLTGPTSVEKSETFTEYMTEAVSRYPTTTDFGYYDFWVDGYKNEIGGEFIMTDNTLDGISSYKWSTVESEWLCIYLVLKSTPTPLRSDFNGESCDIFVKGNKACRRGAICRTKPAFER